MPFDGSGNFQALTLPDFPAIGGQPIYASQFNNVITDLINGLSSTMARSGETPMTGDLQMGGNSIGGVAAGAVAGDLIVFGQAGAQLAAPTFVGTIRQDHTLGTSYWGSQSSSLSPVSTPAGAMYFGSPNNLDLDLGQGGVHRARFRAASGLQLFGVGGQSLGLYGATGRGSGNNFIEFFDPTGSKGGFGYSSPNNDVMYLFNTVGGIDLYTGGVARLSVGFTGVTNFYQSINAPSFVGALIGNASTASSVPWTGVTGRPIALSQFINDLGGAVSVSSFNSRTGAVSLTSGDVTGALGYTPLSGISSGQIISALGYTPYNSSNPSGYITSIVAVNSVVGPGQLTDISISRVGSVVTITRTYGGPDSGGGA